MGRKKDVSFVIKIRVDVYSLFSQHASVLLSAQWSSYTAPPVPFPSHYASMQRQLAFKLENEVVGRFFSLTGMSLVT